MDFGTASHAELVEELQRRDAKLEKNHTQQVVDSERNQPWKSGAPFESKPLVAPIEPIAPIVKPAVSITVPVAVDPFKKV